MIKELRVEASSYRLDHFVSSSFEEYTRSYITKLISEGNVTVNGKIASKAGVKISIGDVITINIPAPVDASFKPMDIPLDIVYEDEDLLIINKKQGMVVHPAPGHHDDTLVNALMNYLGDDLSDINGVNRPGIVHRLDKDTSGLMLAVKNNETHLKIANMMANHEIKRQYRALCYGHIESKKGTIDAPIGRSDKDRRKMTVKEGGKPSVTHFEVVNRYKEATDLSLLLETGRTHQIRAHLTYIGHPLLGDPLYAPRKKAYGLNGQCLHSSSIEFIHPNKNTLISISTELPEYYEEVLEKLTID